MSDVISRRSSAAGPAIPAFRGPPLATPRDSVSEAAQPPRRPPSRSASREPTPRAQPHASTKAGTPTNGGRPPLSPRSPDAAVPTASTAEASSTAAGGSARRQPQYQLQHHGVSGERSSSRVTLDDGGADTHTQATESIAFDLEPSVTSRATGRRMNRSGSAATQDQIDDITFEVLPSATSRAPSGAVRDTSERTDNVTFDVSPSVASRKHSGATRDNEPDEQTDEITFEVYPGSPGPRGLGTTYSESINFAMESSQSGARNDGTGVSHEQAWAGGTAPLVDTAIDPASMQPTDTIYFEQETDEATAHDSRITDQPEEPATEAPAPRSLTRDDLITASDGADDGSGPTSSVRKLRNDTVARTVETAAADNAQGGPKTPPSVEGGPGSPAAAPHTPTTNPTSQAAPPAPTPSKAKVVRGGAAVTPRAAPPQGQPRRIETRPREPRERSRSEMMSDRPWRNSSPLPNNARKRSYSSAGKDARMVSPEVTRAQMMNDRPWRTSSASPGGRKPIVWAAPKNSTAHNSSLAARWTHTPVKTRAELMNERPWRSVSPAGPPKPRSESHRQRRKAAKKRSMSPIQQQLQLQAELAPLVHSLAAVDSKYKVKDRPEASQSHPSGTDGATPARMAPLAGSRNTSGAGLDGSAVAPLTASPPPLLLRSPWAVMAEDVQELSEMINQAGSLRNILATMRERERQVTRAVQRIATRERQLARVTAELYDCRDAYVSWRGEDVNGAPLWPPKPGGKTPSQNLGRSSSTAPPDFASRLYPGTSSLSPAATAALLARSHRQRSILSDSDVSDTEFDEHADAVAAWRRERAKLRARKATLVHQSKDLKHNIHRGTNIKSLSSVTATSARAPLERAAMGRSSRIDEDGYDVLARLRIQAKEATVAMEAARETHTAAQQAALTRSRGSQKYRDDTTARRNGLEREFEQASEHLRQTLERAQALRNRAEGYAERDRKARREEIDYDEYDSGNEKGWCSPPLADGIAHAVEAPASGKPVELSRSEVHLDAARLLAAHMEAAEDVATRAHERRRAGVDATNAGRARSRSGSRPATARIRV